MSIGATPDTVVLEISGAQVVDAGPVLFTHAARILPSVFTMYVGSTMPDSAVVGVATPNVYETRLFAG